MTDNYYSDAVVQLAALAVERKKDADSTRESMPHSGSVIEHANGAVWGTVEALIVVSGVHPLRERNADKYLTETGVEEITPEGLLEAIGIIA